ncbi:DUF3318 domain-containing protein [Pararobbsia silviterrae]|nr:DUF3318 domain-containing protein [Pararobbsia silviterrae]
MNRPNDPRVAIEVHRRRNGGTDRKSLAIRKEILLLRCELERLEVREATAELRGRFAHFGWLRMLMPRMSGRGGLAGLGHMLKDYPFLSSVVSLALTHGPKLKGLGRLRPLLKFGAVGFGAWQVVRLWRAANEPSDASAPGA